MPFADEVTLLALEIGVIVLRICFRWVDIGIGNWQLDDYLMPLIGAVSGSLIWTRWVVSEVQGNLSNATISEEARATLLETNPTEYATRQYVSKISLVVWTQNTVIIWSLKVCLAIFYSRLASRLSNLQLQVRIAYFFIGATYIAVQLTILLSCRPISRNWQIYPNPGNACHPDVGRINIWTYFGCHMATDLYLLYIPLPLLWKVNISRRRKIGLLSLFSGGIFTMVATVVRTTTLLGIDPASIGLWSCLEIFIAVSVTNAPILFPPLRRWVRHIQPGEIVRQIQSSYTTSKRPLRSNNTGTTANTADTVNTTNTMVTSGTDDERDGGGMVQTSTFRPFPLRGITVDREVSVTTGPPPTTNIGNPVCQCTYRHGDEEDCWDFTAPKKPLGSYWSVGIGTDTSNTIIEI